MTTELSAGIGLKPEHYEAAFARPANGLWFEVHPENYMAGGTRLNWLRRFAERFPLSLHGVALSLAADAAPDRDHLARFRRLVDEINPVLVSEHLAWSSWRGAYHPDLLPFPRTNEALQRISDNIDQTQEALGRQIAIENPTHYVVIDRHEYSEAEFLRELVGRTGCALLLDLNNVFVSAHNLQFSADEYLRSFPGEAVTEVHLAGFEPDSSAANLVIDSHSAAVSEPVWSLLEAFVDRFGPRPVLIERDDKIPPFSELLAERQRAASILTCRLEEAA